MSLAQITYENALVILETIIALGIEHICLAPGSRSTPFALALASLPKKMHTVHFDERGLAFYALGRAKAAKKGVAIVVTSGTAVANLLPAVIEGFLSHTPLLLLTADRPHELRQIGSNQTIDQVKLFSSFTHLFIDLPLSDPLTSKKYIASRVSYAMAKMDAGPVHINCMIREPFLPLTPKKLNISPCKYFPSAPTASLATYEAFSALINKSAKGIIVVGELNDNALYEPLTLFAEKCNWPILTDITGRCSFDSSSIMTHHLFLIEECKDLPLDLIMHVGGRLTSKSLSSFLTRQNQTPYVHIDEKNIEYDPLCQITHKVQTSPVSFFYELEKKIERKMDASWLIFWQENERLAKHALASFFAKAPFLSEPYILYSLPEDLPLFVSNSMPIRDADLVSTRKAPTYVNRGTSGIDGNIATAIGIACCLKQKMVAVVGDLAALHDLSSLALMKQTPLILVIINNGGGGIFSFLPIHERQEEFEEFFAAAHSEQFAEIAKGFSIPHISVDTKESWHKALAKALAVNSSIIIECHTKRTENLVHHKQLKNSVKNTLCSTINNMALVAAPS